MNTRKSSTLRIGSVSSGTMRPEDLIPSFLWEAGHLRLSRAERTKLNAIERRVNSESVEEEYYTSEEADWDLEELFDILENHCPDYCYFGASEDDGANYGCWPCIDALEEAVRCEDVVRVDDLADVERGEKRLVMHVSDHGNVTLYRRARGRWVEVWSVV